jgi:hypothetical protein
VSSIQSIGLNNSTLPTALIPKKEPLLSGDQFGHAVALWDDLCLVSATKRGVLSSQGRVDVDGVVYVFKRNEDREWRDTETILASYTPDDGYGESLSLYANTAIVGAPRDNTFGTSAGVAYIYFSSSSGSGTRLGNVQRISADNPEAGDYFGYSVAIIPGAHAEDSSSSFSSSLGALVIGAYGHNRDGHAVTDSGAVFIFANSGSLWYQATVLQPSQPYASGLFGWSVAGAGNVVAVGSPGAEAVYVFHLEGVEHDCPHEGGAPDQMPSACQPQEGERGGEGGEGEQHPRHRHRHLQGGGGGGGGGAPGGHEQQRHVYSVWEWVEVLHVQNDLEDYKGDLFGTSVSVTNDTALFLVIGAPYDNDGGREAGAVIVTCLLPTDDIWSSWSPDDASSHHRHRHRHLRHLQGGGGGGGGAPEGQQQQQPGQEQRDHSQNVWNIRSSQYATDKDGSFWMTMTKQLGSNPNEMYGYRTALSSSHLLIGTHAGPLSRGRAELLVLNTTTSIAHTLSPVYKGPLYQKEWLYESNLFDYQGGPGDYFGSALALQDDSAVVGGYLTGFTDSFDVGTGGASLYDAFLVTRSDDSTSSSASTSSGSVFGQSTSVVSLVMFLVVVGVGVGVVAMQYSRGTLASLASLLPSVGGSGRDGSRKDLDTSVSSVDTVDMDSRHPLTRPTSVAAQKSRGPKPSKDSSSPYARPAPFPSEAPRSTPPSAVTPSPPVAKPRDQSPVPNKYSTRPSRGATAAEEDNDDDDDMPSVPPPSRRAAAAAAASVPEQTSRQVPARSSKTSKYLQASSGGGAAYGRPKHQPSPSPHTDSDSDSDHSAAPTRTSQQHTASRHSQRR